MKGIIVYKSNYGCTKQYAEWIAGAAGFECLPVEKVKKSELGQYGTIVVGSPVFANKPLLSGWIRKNWKRLSGKKVLLFTTSGAGRNSPALKEGVTEGLGAEIASRLEYYPLDGRMVMAGLTPLHRFLVRLGQKMEKDPAVRAEMGRDTDRVNREEIGPIVEALSSFNWIQV